MRITGEENHITNYEIDWLRTHAYNPRLEDAQLLRRSLKLWGSELGQNLPVVEYEEVMTTEEGVAKWLKNVNTFKTKTIDKDTYGIGFVDGVPPTPEATEKLGKRICFIRESHYGAFWDFTANNAHGDTAYTSIALPAHTDTTYFTDPVGLQLFHLIEFTGKGGASLYVDGFQVASQLQKLHPESYEALTTIRTPAHSAGDEGVTITPTPRMFPILNVDPLTNELYQVRFNNDDRSVFSRPHGGPAEILRFYKALKDWTQLLKKKGNEFWIQLTPGRAVVVDNWRVLHGRRVDGALVMSDGGICCIDEFDKMTDTTRLVLHEFIFMEQQTISVATANPRRSRYDKRMTLVDNINLPRPLISRFDLLFIVVDRPKIETDTMLAKHITSLYTEDVEAGPTLRNPVTTDFLKAYIRYAKANVHPSISMEARQELVDCYLALRHPELEGDVGSKASNISATARQLESMIILSEAHARMRLSRTVDEEDVSEAYR
ncbi:hypothetical protein HDV05_004185, partial [Chytridiales sp. JEL 0842]